MQSNVWHRTSCIKYDLLNRISLCFVEAWQQVTERVQDARTTARMKHLSCASKNLNEIAQILRINLNILLYFYI